MQTPLVLVVEDNTVMRRIAELQLNRFNIRVHTAINGEEAVRLVQLHTYTLILMDIAMPIMDGFEATLHIRECERNCRTPIIAITASNSEEECRSAGMDDYVAKPADFGATLRKWLPGYIAA